MRFIVSSQSLLRSLQSISGVLNSSNTLPILDDFLFELNDNTLQITASDLETTMRVTIETNMAEEGGSVAIPAKILLELLKTYGDTPLTFTIDKLLGIEIAADEAKFKIAGHNADEFPKAPQMDEVATIVLPAELLLTAINKTIFATGSDDLRPAMSGVYCDLSPDSVIFVATDAHKLVRYKRSDVSASESTTFIMPKKPLNQLKNILSADNTEVNVEYNGTNARFSFKNTDLVCRLIEGRYPNYEAVIPTDNPNTLIVDRLSLITTLRRASFFANKSTNQIRLTISGQELYIDAEDVDFAHESRQRLSCSFNGEDMEIGFNSRFLVEMLTNLNTENIRLEMSAPNRAGILRPVEGENPAEDILMLVMPVMLNS
ncbi:MAG: DNA polymerase III subunit beta [Bacteroidetes bacterium HGW-Bacteroidetes-11]|jgi:DNA polymerase-3 subunit beta|nr:MAG: DNA polymerase III subunit beta [Bacteroidetes bacterium HGW-Bacteroidetes-11]